MPDVSGSVTVAGLEGRGASIPCDIIRTSVTFENEAEIEN